MTAADFSSLAGVIMYLVAVTLRIRAGFLIPGLRIWYWLSVPLGLTLAGNQIGTIFGDPFPAGLMQNMRLFVVPLVWIWPVTVGLRNNRARR